MPTTPAYQSSEVDLKGLKRRLTGVNLNGSRAVRMLIEMTNPRINQA